MFVNKSWDNEILEELELKYKKGYAHGYFAALRDPNRGEEVLNWTRTDNDIPIAPPASYLEGTILEHVRMDENGSPQI